MAKIKFGLTDVEEPEARKFENWDFTKRPVPQGEYEGKLRFLRLKTNSKGNPMLNGLFVIDEPKELADGKANPKAKYNGAPAFFNQNIMKDQLSFVKEFLDAFGPKKATWRAFADDSSGQNVTDGGKPVETFSKFAGVVLDGENRMVAFIKPGEFNGQKKIDVKRWVSWADAFEADPDTDDNGAPKSWRDDLPSDSPVVDSGDEDDDDLFAS